MPPKITRPLIRWFGGKWMLAPWIISLFPPHRVYVEPFGGGGSVLLRKPRSYAEVYNDLDSQIVNLFRVLRSEHDAGKLELLLRLTPFAREEFENSYGETGDPVEDARRLVIKAFMGFGANAHACDAKGFHSTGFRGSSNRSGSTPASDWKNYPDAIQAFTERLQGVTIERRDARQVMTTHDSPETLHYVDPPYILATRGEGQQKNVRKRMYRHDMEDSDHVELIDFLEELRGMVILSGYEHEIYDRKLTGWAKCQKQAYADGARPRMETVWLNPPAASFLRDVTSQKTFEWISE